MTWLDKSKMCEMGSWVYTNYCGKCIHNRLRLSVTNTGKAGFGKKVSLLSLSKLAWFSLQFAMAN